MEKLEETTHIPAFARAPRRAGLTAADDAFVAAPPRRRKGLPAALLLLAAAAAAALVWFFYLRAPAPPPNVIEVSGRVEGDDASVASKAAGRIRELTVREGDRVQAGQTLASLEDDQQRAREEQAQAAVAEAETRIARAHQQLAILRSQLEQAQLSVEQARVEAQGRVLQAEAQVAAAEAQLAQAEAAHALAGYDEEKFTKLAESGDVGERARRQAQASAAAQAAVVRAARRQVEVARGGLTAARAGLLNPPIRTEQAAVVRQQMLQAQSDIDGAQSDAARARALLREVSASRGEMTLTAPFDGTVATRAAEPGEVVAPGTPLLTLVNLNALYVRAFVPEGQIGRVRVGQAARVFLDSDPARPIEAVVSRIDPEASFTPENTYFREDRVKQVVGVKLQLTDPQGFAKPGMPADAEILVEGNVWPARRGR